MISTRLIELSRGHCQFLQEVSLSNWLYHFSCKLDTNNYHYHKIVMSIENIQLFVCYASALSLHFFFFFLRLCFNFSSFGCWRLLAALRKSWSSWRRRTLMWQFQMMPAVLCAIMYIIILSVLQNRRVTNLYLSMCLYFQESMRKPRCIL